MAVIWSRIILCLSLLVLMAVSASAEIYLSQYEAVFEVAQNKARQYANVQAVLRITYTTNQPLSSGYKFIGSDKISNVMVTDGEGRPVGFTVEKFKETKVSFNFPVITSGSKTIVIAFVIEDAIKDRLLYGAFDAPWVGKWQIPVNNSVYRFIFPCRFTYSSVDTNFVSFNKTMIDGRQAVEVLQPLLAEAAFSLKVKPSFGEHSFTFFTIMVVAASFIILYIIINVKNLPDTSRLDMRELTPSEVAYLKKGLKHSICVCVFDLLQLGRLMKKPPNELQSLRPDDTLYAYEMLIMDYFKGIRTLKHLFQDSDITKRYKAEMIASLSRKGCLKEAKADMKLAARIIWMSVIAAVVLIATSKTSGVGGFYLILSLITPLVGFLFGVILYKRRPKSGRAKYMLEKWEKTVENHSFAVRQGNPIISYGVAILGLGILTGTVFGDYLGYVSYVQAFHSSSSTGCSGCSVGTSSGDGGGDSGGGDGGGSGGCGGCGGGGD